MWVKVRGLLGHGISWSKNRLSILDMMWNFFTLARKRLDGSLTSPSELTALLIPFTLLFGWSELSWAAKNLSPDQICLLAYQQGGVDELLPPQASDSGLISDRRLPIVKSDKTMTLVPGQARYLDIPDSEITWIREWANKNGAKNVAQLLDAARDFMIKMANSYRLKKDPSKIFVPSVSIPVGISKDYIENFLARAEASVNARAFIESKILTGLDLLNDYEAHLINGTQPSPLLLKQLGNHFEVSHVEADVQAIIFRMAATEPSRIRKGFGGKKLEGYPVSTVRGLDGLHKSDVPGIVSRSELGRSTNVTEVNNLTPSGKSNLIQILEAIRLIEIQKGIPENESLAAHILRHEISPDQLAETNNVFHDVMLANAHHWTQSLDGILVMVGPGALNTAHPDISAISQVDSVPAIKWSDLYFHNGAIYLNDGTRNFANHKKVAGIYSRQDPRSCLADPRLGVGMYWPDAAELKRNDLLAARINNKYPNRKAIRLENGTPYLFVKDRQGRIVDVLRDSNGNAMMLPSSNRLGRNPRSPTEEPPPVAEVVENRSLWISNVGGDLADTKDWQALVDQVYSEKFRPSRLPVDQRTLSTPKPLNPQQLKLYFEGKLDGEFVLKEVRGSSGVGVHFKMSTPAAIFEMKFKEAKAEFEKNGRLLNWTVEPFDIPFLVTQALALGGEGKFVDVTNDIRVFVLRRHDGKLFVWGFLGRTALPGSTWSNTGKGGGYVYAFIYDPKNPNEKPVDLTKSLLSPKTNEMLTLSASGSQVVIEFLQQLSQVESILRFSMQGNPSERQRREDQAQDRLLSKAIFNPFAGFDDYKDASNLSVVNAMRHEALPYLDIRLEVGVHRLWSLFKGFEQQKNNYKAKKSGAINPDFGALRAEVLEIIENLRRLAEEQVDSPAGSRPKFAYEKIADLILQHLAKPVNVRGLPKEPQKLNEEEIRQRRLSGGKVKYEFYNQPIQLVERRLPVKVGDKLADVVAVGEVTSSSDPQFARYLGIIKSGGGRVFMVRYKDIKTGKLLPDIVSADHYFIESTAGVRSRVLNDGERFVAIDFGDPNVLAGLAHEAQHVAFYRQVLLYLQDPNQVKSEARRAIEALINSSRELKTYVANLSNGSKVDAKSLTDLAKKIVLSPEGREVDEERSLRWELSAEAYGITLPERSRSDFNDPKLILRARSTKSFGYVNRNSYPQMVRVTSTARTLVVAQIKALKLKRSDHWSPSEEAAQRFTEAVTIPITKSLKLAATIRKRNIEELSAEYVALAEQLGMRNPNQRGYAEVAQKMHKVKVSIETWSRSTLWHSVVSGADLNRMTSERTNVLISQAFQRIYQNLKHQNPFAPTSGSQGIGIETLTPEDELAAMIGAEQAIADPQAHLSPSQQQ